MKVSRLFIALTIVIGCASCKGEQAASDATNADSCSAVTVSAGDSPVGIMEALGVTQAKILDTNGSPVFVRDGEGDALFRGVTIGETLSVCNA